MPKLFDGTLRVASQDHAELVRRYELYRTIVEFLAALTFVIGSVFFFYDSLIYAGTWFFLIGSILFAVRPTIRLLLELHLAHLPVPKEFRPYGAEPVASNSKA
ncbi:YrhK-like protein [Roseibium hamelinense]|uniref:YrhK-like protein n=1 Tax=Roseibium hamelinense TaxID=150831 RepID=A0A562TGM5_9HYPH|nr:YrhK family protein [Roseibium hamelinense]MTI46042.1 cobalamin biosynthesis protein CobQ [Roseibium hamelinense]TWI92767.1 YrhK-like protein [Roseibium hamelinense]